MANYLWVGGEDTSFPLGATVGVNTGFGTFRAGYGRCAIGGGTLAVPCVSKAFPGGAVTSCWFSFRRTGSPAASYIGLGKSGQSNFLAIRMFNNNTIDVGTVIAGAWTSVATASFSLAAVDKVDVQIANFGTGTVTVNVYYNGSSLISYAGALSVTGVTTLDTVFIVAGTNVFSEIGVSDSSTLAWQGLCTIAGNGNGTTQAWSDPAYTNWNPTTINDANATFTNATGQDEQATINALPSGSFTVAGVKLEARAMATPGAAAANLELGVRNGSGTVGVGSPHALSTAFSTYEDYMTNDPTTAAPWTTLTGYQLNLRSA